MNKILLAVLFIIIYITNFMLVAKITYANSISQKQSLLLSEIDKASLEANQFAFSAAPLVLGSIETEVKTADSRALNLMSFFRRYNSDLFPYADLIVQEADKHGLDYRILPAIAMQESTLCKKIPENSYNCWGWDITGSNVRRFSGYEEGIKVVSDGIKRLYVDKGLTTPSEVMAKYAPHSPGTWSFAVNHFMSLLE
ncbi:hypothetical protein A3C23_03625 [Candidatus Roizmanbacteria bacterium RIFCSPHIGHO2_02_FULL_37_13b]|uniref:Mannosyl-glycoprotein endo-beta-N-acetylglucosamidase-like domain-containing protein n=1 Tax=Candidatus Roizmanbacteria bacterium RIFCSPLOWO2_02_FULL_36_11 TaxID=1802071 RepID=A0A1F7JC26_9BACT|nr:MAG: hypothetical protein A3C23_03625 [Candidatus Roizmanbacteria bacterium RIFCSPHIGHO2_02_FULL_37_13b]OGK53125.1 MAG: hypothetical protein A3H78_01950 [Candidatus Roizmanbacteria bacterium RIFCSPLOWO2_02_FULL_36_11]